MIDKINKISDIDIGVVKAYNTKVNLDNKLENCEERALTEE